MIDIIGKLTASFVLKSNPMECTTVTLAKTKQAPQTNTDTHLTVTDTRTSTHICTLAAGYWRLPVCGAKGFFIQGPISSFVATPQS